MCICVWVCAHDYMYLQKPEESDAPVSEVIGDALCKCYKTKLSLVLSESSTSSYRVNHASSTQYFMYVYSLSPTSSVPNTDLPYVLSESLKDNC